ncbi:MAG: phosphoenolpyruvate--protein phosphotransferase [Deltaproteobacteria bacterium]|nr:phosphoenolpyruvate--protein phosphotransferase [Candidatus Zymogenaceae bacterium]
MERPHIPPNPPGAPEEKTISAHIELVGLAASSGVGIGTARLLERKPAAVGVFSVDDRATERERYLAAINRVGEQLSATAAEAEARFGGDEARIYHAQAELLSATLFQTGIPDTILEKGINSEAVIREEIRLLEEKNHTQPDGSPPPGMSDITDILRQISFALIHDNPHCLILEENSVILADELLPSDMILINGDVVVGLITEKGGPYSHAAIMARSLGIPAVMGVPNAMEIIQSGDQVVVDGSRGRVLIHPNSDELDTYTQQIVRDRTRRDDEKTFATLPAVSKDGVTVSLLANAGRPDDVRSVLKSGAGGIGLFRTELPFLMGEHFVSEDEQYELYRRVVKGMNGLPVTFRTLDIGGDKIIPGTISELEANPFLGLRSVRFSLKHPALLTAQLRAIIRAAAFGPVDVMFPMVTTTGEMDRLSEFFHQVTDDLARKGIVPERTPRMGVMIEVPSAAILSEKLFSRVQFASIGTNDLIQYLLAVDRTNRDVSHLYSPFDPAVLTTIRDVARAAQETNTELSICGEAAADPLSAVVFASFGISILSMEPISIAGVKRAVRAVDLSEAGRIVEEAMTLDSAREVQEYLERELDIDAPR